MLLSVHGTNGGRLVQEEASASEQITSILPSIFASLGPQQQAVARFMMENTSALAFLSAGDVGRRTGTHSATVVRLAQRLGYDGYPSLQQELRQQSQQYPAYLDMADRVGQTGSLEEIVVTSFTQASRNLDRAARTLDLDAVRRIIEALLNCRKVLVVGLGVARPAAVYLASSLRFTGADVHEAGDSIALAQEIALLHRGDVLFVIDYHRYYREAVHFAEAAQVNGATVCALTDSTVSALAPFADHLLAVPSEAAATPRTSLAASMVAIEVLLAAITAESREHTAETMSRIDHQYKQARIFTHTGRASPPGVEREE